MAKWKSYVDSSGRKPTLKYYDAKRFDVSYDPAGGAHFSKHVSGRQKARSLFSDIAFYRHGILGLIILVTIVRFVFMREFGFSDDFFKTYPNAVDAYGNTVSLYYFDVFGWFKSFAFGVSAYKNSFTGIFDSLNQAFDDDVVTNFFNGVIFVLNFLFAIIKVLICAPLSIIGLVLGGPFAQWTGSDGWITQFLGYSIPYAEPPKVDFNDGWSMFWYYFFGPYY